jgi:hypothetical protein
VVGTAARAELLELKPPRIVPAILLRRVIALPALDALQRDHVPVGFPLLGHCTTPSRRSSRRVAAEALLPGRRGSCPPTPGYSGGRPTPRSW